MINALIRNLRELWFFLTTFFPVQLFLLHLRRSHLLIVFWVVLFGFVDGFLAESYGLRFLFLSPEYMDEVNFWSYLMVGMTAGLFVVAFHINSYIYYSYRYPFMATLSRPLWKFSINNSIIPVLFYLFYLGHMLVFLRQEGQGWDEILIHAGGLLLGTFLMVGFTFTYFFGTIRTLAEPQEGPKREKGAIKSLSDLVRRGSPTREPQRSQVNYYLKSFVKVRLTRNVSHYKRDKLMTTIGQHHFSAAIYFVALIAVVILLSLVSHRPRFIIPAGATVFLIFSIYLMVVGAFYTRLKTWTLTIGILALLLLNYLSGFEPFHSINYAYGMNYDVSPARYDYPTLDSLTTDSLVNSDIAREREVLETWRRQTGEKRPLLVVLNVSGGGQRSALWTLKVLQEVDRASGGRFFRHTHLITGSSGGMLGAAFYREVKYQHQEGTGELMPYDEVLQEYMALDLLNATCFTLAVNDLFFALRSVEVGGYRYPLDRGYTFDRKLANNTRGVLDRNFSHYRDLEGSARMPTMILGPSIVGDGRKLLMGTRGLSYLTFTRPDPGVHKGKEFDAVEYSRFFARQDADNLSYLTALRLSASFPYITPLVNMPCEPGIELIDAGVRDNEGFELALRYIYAHREWVKKNTRGVMMVQIKANRPNEVPMEESHPTKLDKLTLPVGGVLKSFYNFQVFNKSFLMQLSREELDLPLDVVRFSLFEEEEKDVSLSWHLTRKEKKSITSTFDNALNQEALNQSQRMLNGE